jgi:hypothetical protein
MSRVSKKIYQTYAEIQTVTKHCTCLLVVQICLCTLETEHIQLVCIICRIREIYASLADNYVFKFDAV